MIIQTRSISVGTPLGKLLCRTTCGVAEASEGQVPEFLEVGRVTPTRLPDRMSVLGCIGIVASGRARQQIKDFRFECVWAEKRPLCTGPETGEGLDAQGWENESHILVVGTEDEDYLHRRLIPSIVILSDKPYILISSDRNKYPIEYTDNGLTITLESIPAGVPYSFHFVIAWNPNPEPVECSCWFAVDIPHEDVVAGVQAISS